MPRKTVLTVIIVIGDGFARWEDILQDAISLRLFAIHWLHFILVGTDFRYSSLDVPRLGVPSPYQLGVPHRSGAGLLAHGDDTIRILQQW